MIVAAFIRKIVGSEVHEKHPGRRLELLQRSIWRMKCNCRKLILYADSVDPMKNFTMQAKLYDLGVVASDIRPWVSNDNPYSESFYRMLQYCPQWPRNGFGCVVQHPASPYRNKVCNTG